MNFLRTQSGELVVDGANARMRQLLRRTRVEGHAAMGVAVRVSPSEMRSWAPERITQFFSGIAQMIRAGANSR